MPIVFTGTTARWPRNACQREGQPLMLDFSLRGECLPQPESIVASERAWFGSIGLGVVSEKSTAVVVPGLVAVSAVVVARFVTAAAVIPSIVLGLGLELVLEESAGARVELDLI